MVKLRLFLGTGPYDRLALVMDLKGEIPGVVRGHMGNILHQTLGHMLEGVEIIVEDNDFVVGIGFADRLAGAGGGLGGGDRCGGVCGGVRSDSHGLRVRGARKWDVRRLGQDLSVSRT